jgi:hypothetical protein
VRKAVAAAAITKDVLTMVFWKGFGKGIKALPFPKLINIIGCSDCYTLVLRPFRAELSLAVVCTKHSPGLSHINYSLSLNIGSSQNTCHTLRLLTGSTQLEPRLYNDSGDTSYLHTRNS